MRCEVIAVGTELLLGQVVDTNGAWLGERLAEVGIDSYAQTKVGDNVARIAEALQIGLARSDAVIVCGGLGPTPDDVTREALAKVMSVPLERDEDVLDVVRALFAARGRAMPPSNARQADVPRGATVIPQTRGTAPGLVCPVGRRVVYAVPGVPEEMREMVERAVLPDLVARTGAPATILSRRLRTWGLPESTVAELVSPRVAALDTSGGGVTIAFLASGTEGITVRVTAKAAGEAEARAMLDAEEAELRDLLGDAVFGVDDDTMEGVVAALVQRRGLTLGLAESLTGGLAAARLARVPGASTWLRGGVVAYATAVKTRLLGVRPGPAVSEDAAADMAEGARRVLGASVGLSTTGVAGPGEQDGRPAGTVFLGLATDGGTEVVHQRLWGDRERVRQFAAVNLLDLLRRRLGAHRSLKFR